MLRIVTLAALGLSLGCTDRTAPLHDTGTAADVEIVTWDRAGDPTGVLDFLNDPATTSELLDEHVGIDRRAALSLVDHRDGRDRVAGTEDDDLYDDLEEVDAQYYVGAATLDKIYDYALWEGWIDGDQDAFYGRWDGVDFTYTEAQRVVRLANLAKRQTLALEVDLDARAVDSILAARPIDSIRELSLLYYVGESALTDLKAYAAGDMVLQDRRRPGE